METKKETQKKANEIVFEIKPKTNKTNANINKGFPLGFLAGFLVMGILAVGIVYAVLAPSIKNGGLQNSLNPDQAKTKAELFINENLMPPGSKIIIKGIEEKNGLYKIAVSDGTSADVDTYLSKDGKMFFLRPFDIEKMEADKKNTAQATPEPPTVKNDKPEVELFVMSHCPFGTQIEKGMLPVVETLKDKIKFDVKFTDYAMHGEKELQEELNQYCIKTGEPAKYNAYLKCFIESSNGDSASCLTQAKINKTKLNSCVAATDAKYKVTANFADKSTWKGNFPTFNIYKEDNTKYSVQGSPTLIINGTASQPARDSASLLKAVCSAFNNPPKECETKLSSESPAPGFGTGTSSSGANASCGN